MKKLTQRIIFLAVAFCFFSIAWTNVARALITKIDLYEYEEAIYEAGGGGFLVHPPPPIFWTIPAATPVYLNKGTRYEIRIQGVATDPDGDPVRIFEWWLNKPSLLSPGGCTDAALHNGEVVSLKKTTTANNNKDQVLFDSTRLEPGQNTVFLNAADTGNLWATIDAWSPALCAKAVLIVHEGSVDLCANGACGNSYDFILSDWEDLKTQSLDLSWTGSSNLTQCKVVESSNNIAENSWNNGDIKLTPPPSGIVEAVTPKTAVTMTFGIECENDNPHHPGKYKDKIDVNVSCAPDPGDWSPCSAICGGGTRYRDTQTAQCLHPRITQPCNTQPCGSGWIER